MAQRLQTLDEMLPAPPSFSEDEIEECRKTGDYIPLLFQWYQFVGLLANIVASIDRRSPTFREVVPQHYYVLVGLLHRCARLMLSNVALSHEGRFGETTAIVDRCIFESAIKATWLCENPAPDNFTRYLADGLKTELELRQEITSRVTASGDKPLPIEARMLASIGNHIAAAGLTDGEVMSAKKLPNLASMLETTGFNRLAYVVAQRIGSHHIHGTWPSLLYHYLEEIHDEDGSRFVPRDANCSTHINQFMSTPRVVLRATQAYVDYAFIDDKTKVKLHSLIESTQDAIMKIYVEAKGGNLGN